MIQTGKQNFLRSMLSIKLRANMKFLTIFQKKTPFSVRHLQNCQSCEEGVGSSGSFSKKTKPFRRPISWQPGKPGSSPSLSTLATK